MMSQQHSSLTSMFADDPFFSQERLLWPLNREALASLQEDFFNRRTKLADSLLAEFHDGTQHSMELLRQGPFLPLSLRRSSNTVEPKAESPSKELREVAQQKVSSANGSGDLLVTLDARGYAPEDITVKLEGRSLAVVAMKQAGAEESQSSSCSSASSTCSSSSSSSASSQTGFVQRINLPPHLDLSGLSCSLMDDGQLRIDAPAAKRPVQEEEEQQVPIRFRSSLEFPISKNTQERAHTD